MDPYFLFFTGLVCVALLLGVLYFPLWAVLHSYLTPRLDNRLFREPYFHPKELINYRYFPLSLLRSLNYVFLIAWPALAKKRRFQGYPGRVQVSSVITLLCRLQLTMAFVGLAVAVIFFIWGGFMALFVL